MTTFLSMLAFAGLIAAQFAAVVAVHHSKVAGPEETRSERPETSSDVQAWNSMLLH